MTALTFQVIGTPAPQGSKRHVGGGRMVESSKKVAPWRTDVAHRAAEAMTDQHVSTFTGPVDVNIQFTLHMPKGRRAADRKRGSMWSTRKPDLDKLTRSTLDALVTAGVLSDDSIVAVLWVSKRETTGVTGARISIEHLPHEEPQ